MKHGIPRFGGEIERSRLDRMVAYFSPSAALKRHAARTALAYYEAAEPSRMRNFYRNRGSQNQNVQRSAAAIRTQARHLVQNHDLARGALRTMVNNIAGPNGIGVEPQPRGKNGEIHEEYQKALKAAWRDWCVNPEVTHQMSFSRLQRAVLWDRLRDGEIFGQHVMGARPDLDHGTQVPYSLEMFEADLVPLELNDETKRIIQGVERNGWGRPVALHVIKSEPWKISSIATETKRIPWDRVIQLAGVDHIGQVRGISEFASVITRLEDIKDYEESERVAAKIAAMLCAAITKGAGQEYSAGETEEDREINFGAGMIIDDLQVGEKIELIDTKRPNPNLITFRQGQLRGVAAGMGGSYSSFSKDYNGTYSAQRQELVEQWVNYAVLADDFVGDFIQPVWRKFVETAHLSGVVRAPSDIDATRMADAYFVAQSMPWIDPLKEALGWEALAKAGFASEVEVIRRRGRNPDEVLDEVAKWHAQCDAKGVVFSSNEAAMAAIAGAMKTGD